MPLLTVFVSKPSFYCIIELSRVAILGLFLYDILCKSIFWWFWSILQWPAHCSNQSGIPIRMSFCYWQGFYLLHLIMIIIFKLWCSIKSNLIKRHLNISEQSSNILVNLSKRCIHCCWFICLQRMEIQRNLHIKRLMETG